MAFSEEFYIAGREAYRESKKKKKRVIIKPMPCSSSQGMGEHSSCPPVQTETEKRNGYLAEINKLTRLLCECEKLISGLKKPPVLSTELKEWFRAHKQYDQVRLASAKRELEKTAKALGYEITNVELS